MRGTSLAVDAMNDEYKADDRFYMRRMREILDAFPTNGPPYCPVQLCPHVYIGSQRNADDVDGLRTLGITHVLNCAGTRRFDLSRSPYPTSAGIDGYLMIPAEDHDQYDIMQHFPDAIAFLDQCASSGGRALVHCNLGINRSGAVCAAYLMVHEKKSLLEVIGHLKDKRQYVLCNKNFRRQLIRFARCKGLPLDVAGGGDPTAPRNSDLGANRTGASPTKNGAGGGGCYSTQSLDRSSRTRPGRGRIADQYAGVADEPRRCYTLPRNDYLSAQNYKNNRSRHDGHHAAAAAAGSDGHQLESVPERKPICDFAPTPSKYDSRLRKNDSSASLAGSVVGGGTPKSVTFRRPTVSDVSDDGARIRNSSPSPKLGFLSRIGTRIARQRSLTNIAGSSLDDDEPAAVGGRPTAADATPERDDSSLSTTRPLRVYKRSSTDTELYRKPSSFQVYRRADTIASTSPELERAPSHLAEDSLLPQEFLYHKRNLAHLRNSKIAGKTSEANHSGSSINLLARLKPVPKAKSSYRTNTGI